MKDSKRLQEERAFVVKALGSSVICPRCNATLDTFADACTAGLSDECPGFWAIERAKEEYKRTYENHNRKHN